MGTLPARAVPDADPYRPPPDEGLSVVHEEAAFVVLEKPPGLLSAPGRGADKHDSLAVRAQARWPGALLVHRLDMLTSGLMVLALEPGVHALLNQAFREREVHKRYEARVHGVLEGEGTVDLPLAVDWPNRPRQVVDRAHGKPSRTHWRAVGTVDGTTRVALNPVTGRTHQLRVHLQALGHPILGDPFYGRPDGAPRLMLHACRLSFFHPLTRRPVAFDSVVPF